MPECRTESRGLEQGGSGARAYAEAITTYLGLALSRMANRTTTMTTHNRANGSVEQSFIRQAYGFYGEFPEANPFSGSTGSWAGGIDYIVKAVEALPAPPSVAGRGSISSPPGSEPSSDILREPSRVGQAEVRCASILTALEGDRGVVCTDPPYYDMFDYASPCRICFWCGSRATLSATCGPDTLGPLLAPSDEQIVSNSARFGGDRAVRGTCPL